MKSLAAVSALCCALASSAWASVANGPIWFSYQGARHSVLPDAIGLRDRPFDAASWSPDGRHVVYYRGGALYVANASGSRARILFSDALQQLPQYGYDTVPSWSPDGSKVAFFHRELSGQSSLVVVALGGTRTTFGASDDTDLTSLGDSDGIVHQPHGQRFQYASAGPSWSPDGTRLTWGDSAGIVAASWNGTGARRVLALADPGFSGGAFAPTWSPDGTQIVAGYQTGAVAPSGFAAGNGLISVHPDGTGAHVIYAAPAGQIVTDPSFSPDGRHVAFDQVSSFTAVRVIAAGGSGPHTVDAMTRAPGATGTAAPESAEPFWWSPDGRQLLIQHEICDPCGASAQTFETQALIVNPDGSGSHPLTGELPFMGVGSWQPVQRPLATASAPRMTVSLSVPPGVIGPRGPPLTPGTRIPVEVSCVARGACGVVLKISAGKVALSSALVSIPRSLGSRMVYVKIGKHAKLPAGSVRLYAAATARIGASTLRAAASQTIKPAVSLAAFCSGGVNVAAPADLGGSLGVPGRHVLQLWAAGDSGFGAQPTQLITDGQGAFDTTLLLVPPGNVVVSWAGDSRHAPAIADCRFGPLDYRPVAAGAPGATHLTVSCPTTLSASQTLIVSGTLSGAPAGASVTVVYTEPGGATITDTVPAGASGAFTDSVTPSGPGAWSETAAYGGSAAAQPSASAACMTTVTVTTSVTVQCPAPVALNGTISIGGTLAPAIAGAQVTVTYTEPNGTVVTDSAAPDGAGNFTDTTAAAVSGSWTVKAGYAGDSLHLPSSATCGLTVN